MPFPRSTALIDPQLPPSTRKSRTTAILTLAAGGLFVVVPLLVEFVSGEAFILMALAGLLTVAALPGLRSIQEGADGKAGLWGLRMVIAGLLTVTALIIMSELLAGSIPSAAQRAAEDLYAPVGLVALVLVVLGVVGLGIGMARAAILSRTAIWVWIGGMGTALASEAFEQSLRGPVPAVADALPVIGFVLAGCGLLMLGRSALLLSRRS